MHQGALHLIEQLDFEVECEQSDAENQDGEQLARLLRDTLLPVVDEVLDAWDEPDTVLTLPTLALDLGTIERRALGEQAPARLRVLLEEAIARARREARTRSEPDGWRVDAAAMPSRRSVEDEALGQLAAFLRSGRLAWHADLARVDLHVALLDRMLRASYRMRQALLRMLNGVLAQPHALRRLSEQFPERQLTAILKAAAPGHFDALLALHAQLRSAAAHRPSGAAAAQAWPLVLGVALGRDNVAQGLAAVRQSLAMPQCASPAARRGAAAAPQELARLAAWWRRGERDATAEALLDSLLGRAAAAAPAETVFKQDLARALAQVLAEADGARRLSASLPLRQREALLRFLAPLTAGRMLALVDELEGQILAHVSDRVRAAQAHAYCWEEVLAAALPRAVPARAPDSLRIRLYRMLARVREGGAVTDDAAGGRGAPGGEATAGGLAQLAAYLESGRLAVLPEAGRGAAHVALLEGLLERAARLPSARQALLRMLARVLLRPRALRRITEQFPQRQLAALVHAAAPDHAVFMLELLIEVQGGAMEEPTSSAGEQAAWRRLLVDVLDIGHLEGGDDVPVDLPSSAPGVDAIGQREPAALASERAGLARIEAWWRRGRPDAALAARLEHLLLRAEGGAEVSSHGSLGGALELALVRTRAVPDGVRSLVAALPERLLEALLRFLQPAASAGLLALMHEVHARLALRAGASAATTQRYLRCWEELMLDCLLAPRAAVAAATLRARLETLCAAAHDADGVALEGEAGASDQGAVRAPFAADRTLQEVARGDGAAGRQGSAAAVRQETLSTSQAEDADERRTAAQDKEPDAPLADGGGGLASTGSAVTASRPATLQEALPGRGTSPAGLPAAYPVADATAMEGGAPGQEAATEAGAAAQHALAGATPESRAATSQAEDTAAIDGGGTHIAATADRPTKTQQASPGGLAGADEQDDAAAPQGQLVPPDTAGFAAIDRLEAFLHTGRLPTSAGSGGADGQDPAGAGEAHVALLDALLDGAAPAQVLWRMLARSLSDARSARRMVEQFPERQLREILHGIAPAHAAAVAALLESLHGAAAIARTPSRRLRLALWPVLLGAALRVAAGMEAVLVPDTVRRRVLEALPELAPWADPAPAAPADAAQEAALARLQAVLAGQDARRLEEGLIEGLLLRDPNRVLALLHDASLPSSDRDEALRRLGTAGAEPALRALLGAAADSAAGALLAIADELALRARAHAAYPRAEAWGELLALALANPAPPQLALLRGRLFGRPGALRLRPAPSTQLRARRPWQPLEPGRRALPALRRLLAQAGEVQAHGHAKSVPAARGQGEPAAMPALDELLALADSAALEPAQLARLEQRLADACVALAAELARAASSRAADRSAGAAAPPAAPVCAADALPSADMLDAPEWRARIAAHLDADALVAPARRAAMVDSIALAADSSGKARHFLRRILQALLRREALDLDAVTAEIAPQEGALAPSLSPAEVRRTIAGALLAGDAAAAPPAWPALLDAGGELTARLLRLAGARPGWRAVLAGGLPEWMLADIVALGRPDLAGVMQAHPRTEAAAAAPGLSAWRRRLWDAALGLAAAPDETAAPAPAAARAQLARAAAGGDGEIETALLAALDASLTESARGALPGAAGGAATEAISFAGEERSMAGETTTRTNGAGGQHRLKIGEAAMQPRDDIIAPAVPARTQVTSDAAPSDQGPGAAQGERIVLDNCGQVLLAPYLPRLFGMLGLVEKGSFVDAAAAERAVHLLQFATSGETDAPEYRLVLNKLLCGLPLDAPVAAGIAITPEERETVEGMLQALIASWSAIGRTSIEGLRQSFLMRAGELELCEEAWQLTVEPGPFDVLMDRLPWSFSTIKHAWMPLLLHVSWP